MPEKSQIDHKNLSHDGKRQATIEKVSKKILDKISHYGSLNETRQRTPDHPKVNSDIDTLPGKVENMPFVFNAIDTINIKSKNTLSVEDSSFLIQRLEQLAKKANGKKLESWI